MTDRNEDTTDEPFDGPSGVRSRFERRPLLKALGAGAALSLVGATAAAEEHAENGDEEASGDEDDTDDGHFVEDLIDPTFGYPLAADETGDVDLEHVVELTTVEGDGDHENFPQGPPQEGGGEPEQFPYEFPFDPAGIHVEPDDVVHFLSIAGEHTATAFHEKYSNPELSIPTRVPDDVPGFTSPPIVDDESWLYQFSESGVYDVLCLPHYSFGMVMRIVVFDPDEDDLEDEAFAAPSGGELPPNADRVLTAEELQPANIVDSGTVAWGDLSLDGEDAESAAAPAVQVREHSEYGDILVGPDEMTLYMFDQDTQGESESVCYDDCAAAWPPLTVDGDPEAGDGVDAELDTFEREDGELQVVANGWPLYYFAQDQEPGDAEGQGVGDVWWVLGPDGEPITAGSSE